MDQAALRARMIDDLPAGLIAHVDRVVAVARALARSHGLDEARVALAAQGHDLLRAADPADLLAEAEARGLAIDAVDRDEPLLLHGPLAALRLHERFGVTDGAVLDAVRWHTTGHPDLDAIGWCVFVADKVEPHKRARRADLARVEAEAARSLEGAALAYLDLALVQAAGEGWTVHPAAVASRNALLRRARPGR